MTEERLRAWIEGRLPPGERREVSRWIVQCASPALGPLLHGMATEARERRSAAQMAARGGIWAALAARWQHMLSEGLAHLTGGEAGVVLAGAQSSEAEILTLHRGEPDVQISFRPPAAGMCALYLTDEDGQVRRLSRRTCEPGALIVIALSPPSAGAWTLWAGWGALPPEATPEDELAAMLESGAGLRALKWWV